MFYVNSKLTNYEIPYFLSLLPLLFVIGEFAAPFVLAKKLLGGYSQPASAGLIVALTLGCFAALLPSGL